MPYNKAVAITKSDTVDIVGPKELTDAINSGDGGVIACVFEDGSVANVTFTAGLTLPLAIRRVNSTNTTSTLMTALYDV